VRDASNAILRPGRPVAIPGPDRVVPQGPTILTAAGSLYVHDLFAVLAAASFLGDNTNYWIGRYAGPRVFRREGSRFFNPEHLARTRRFYDKYGANTIFFARFMPIVRTFAPFVAGIGRMRYSRFLFYSFSGSVAWVGSLAYAGYYFGTVQVVKQNLTLVIVIIVLISITPGIVEYLRHRFSKAAKRES